MEGHFRLMIGQLSGGKNKNKKEHCTFGEQEKLT